MDLHYLEYMKEIAECQNLSKAAERLHVSQPTLSIYLQKLEQDLGQPLFSRARNRLNLTQAGNLYYQTCCEILNLKEKLYSELELLNLPQIRIGITNSNIPHVQAILSLFQQACPEIELVPTITLANNINFLLEENHLDFALTGGNLNPQVKSNPHICYDSIAEYELMLASSSENPVLNSIKDCQELSPEILAKLNSCPFILQSFGKSKRQYDLSVLEQLQIHPQKLITLNSIQFIQQSVIENNAFTFIPYSFFQDPRILQFRLPVKFYVRRILKYSKNRRMSKYDLLFLQIVKEHFSKNSYYYYLA